MSICENQTVFPFWSVKQILEMLQKFEIKNPNDFNVLYNNFNTLLPNFKYFDSNGLCLHLKI